MSAPRGLGPGAHLALAAVCLAGTLALGLALRWFFAGQPLPLGTFLNLRHAHTHLGYYGVIFPLMWAGRARMGLPAPGPLASGLYALATLSSTAGFLREGYAPLSIAGSTVVLAVWVWSAWPLRRAEGWLAGVFPATAISAAVIPMVAVASARGEAALAGGLVKGFLSLLLLGAALPGALALRGVPAPPRALLLPLTWLAALALGPWPQPLAALAIAGWGAALLAGLARASEPLVGLWAWGCVGAGLVAKGAGLLPEGPQVAIAGLHFMILGPLLLDLGPRALGRRLPRPFTVAFGLSLAVFTASVGMQATPTPLPLPQLAAGSGTATAALLALGAAWLALPRPEADPDHLSEGRGLK